MKHLTTRMRTVAVAAVLTTAASGAVAAPSFAVVPTPLPRPERLSEMPSAPDEGSDPRLEWGVNPAPGQDCPTGSTKLAQTLATEKFDGTGKTWLGTGSTVQTDAQGGWAHHVGPGATGGTKILQTPTVITPGKARMYVKFDVRGDFGEKDLSVSSNNGAGGWFVKPADKATPAVPTTQWRTERIDLTDGANEGTWKNDLLVQWFRDGKDATTVDLDNIEIYQCTPKPVGERGDFNGDGFADAKFVMNDGQLVFVAGTPTKPVSIWRGGTGWTATNWIGSVGDTDGDGFTDLMARGKDGTMRVYRGDGVRGFSNAMKVGYGWNGMDIIIPVGDVNGDTHPDLIARDAKGNMRLYTYLPDGTMTGGTIVGNGWQGYRQIVGIITRNGSKAPTRLYGVLPGGEMKSFTVTSTGRMTGWGKSVGTGWKFSQIVSSGDFDGDGLDDVLATDTAGNAFVFPTNGDGVWKGRLKIPGTYWNAATLIG
ncbi:hypothetical protein KEM60_02116 [Austwickia sp. TVS 96-490-7B]|uniref:FG-GAP repeat domain-containing protein n=1 Tax=Austwickia sp. TVS 96-490-7B TaxID=2830843 RepID=UPI001C575BA8|nr:VCBS repeat-containing protein [Austwickia sp. TVS 96-490-7B]MBW3085905.1 hypothetical protein [Austwickia sp. TVS 96-490-7B]